MFAGQLARPDLAWALESLREAGEIPFHWIADNTRWQRKPSTFVGLDSFTVEDVLTTGERIYNLERYYNQLAGEQPGSDTLPKRFLEEPSTMKGSVGHVCELPQMLEEYYALRGWVNGVTPEAKLKELAIL